MAVQCVVVDVPVVLVDVGRWCSWTRMLTCPGVRLPVVGSKLWSLRSAVNRIGCDWCRWFRQCCSLDVLRRGRFFGSPRWLTSGVAGTPGVWLPGVLSPQLGPSIGVYRHRHSSYMMSAPEPPEPLRSGAFEKSKVCMAGYSMDDNIPGHAQVFGGGIPSEEEEQVTFIYRHQDVCSCSKGEQARASTPLLPTAASNTGGVRWGGDGGGWVVVWDRLWTQLIAHSAQNHGCPYWLKDHGKTF